MATALGSFNLTAPGVRKTPSVRSELSRWPTAVGQHFPPPRPQPANCNALTLANSGFAFPWRGRKVGRWSDVLPTDHDNVVLDIMDRHDTSPKRKDDARSHVGDPTRQISVSVRPCSRSSCHTFASVSWPAITRSRAQIVITSEEAFRRSVAAPRGSKLRFKYRQRPQVSAADAAAQARL